MTPPGGQVLGLPADAVVRVGAAMTVAALSAAAFVAFGAGERAWGALFAITGGALGVGLVGAQALEEEARRRSGR